MNVHSRFPIISFLLLCISATTTGHATTILRMSFEELCDRAPVIIVGRCTAVSSETDPANGAVYTRSTFTVDESLKGATDQRQVTVRMPGGTVSGESVTVQGIPAFQEDEPVVLFLTEPGRAGYPWVMGLGQGCYRISTDPETGLRVVRRDPAGGALYDASTKSLRKQSPAAGPLSLERFKDRVRENLHRDLPAAKEEY